MANNVYNPDGASREDFDDLFATVRACMQTIASIRADLAIWRREINISLEALDARVTALEGGGDDA